MLFGNYRPAGIRQPSPAQKPARHRIDQAGLELAGVTALRSLSQEAEPVHHRRRICGLLLRDGRKLRHVLRRPGRDDAAGAPSRFHAAERPADDWPLFVRYFAYVDCLSLCRCRAVRNAILLSWPSDCMSIYMKPKTPLYGSKHWRQRAEATRTKAVSLDCLKSRDRLLKIAWEYERLARRAEDWQTLREYRDADSNRS